MKPMPVSRSSFNPAKLVHRQTQPFLLRQGVCRLLLLLLLCTSRLAILHEKLEDIRTKEWRCVFSRAASARFRDPRIGPYHETKVI
jgi:hypothetical protein